MLKKITTSFNFFFPTEIRFGLDRLDEFFEIVGYKKIILITGGASFKKSGVLGKFQEKLGKQLIVVEGTTPNPTLEEIDRVSQIARKNRPEMIVGIGGGSVLDSAKCASALCLGEGEIIEYIRGERRIEKALPYIAVPTTAGTGSEVTPWATVWDMKNQKKYSLSSPLIFPKYAIVDPSLTVSLPREQTASTGLDALCQAMEAYWAKSTQPISQALAFEAIRMTFSSLLGAYQNGKNLSYRCGMAQAALFAGMAFSQTRTTACHAISYPLTARFSIPHGAACALTLPTFFEYNSETLNKNSLGDLLVALDANSVQEGKRKILRLMESVGINPKLSAWGVKKEDISGIVSESFTPGRADNNPRDFGRDLPKLLESIL